MSFASTVVLQVYSLIWFADGFGIYSRFLNPLCKCEPYITKGPLGGIGAYLTRGQNHCCARRLCSGPGDGESVNSTPHTHRQDGIVMITRCSADTAVVLLAPRLCPRWQANMGRLAYRADDVSDHFCWIASASATLRPAPMI